MNLSAHFKAATAGDEKNQEPVLAGGIDSMEAAVADITEAGFEVTEANRVRAEFEDVADSLESYRDALSLSQEAGNIDQQAASWMLAAGEAITARVGVKLDTVSVESFSSPSEAADAVELVSMEAANLWEKLVEAIKSMIEKARNALKGLWVKLTDGGAKLAKRAEALSKKARDTKGSPEESTFEASFIEKIHLDGKAPKGSEVVANIKTMDALAKSIFDSTESEIKKAGSDFKTLLESAASGDKFDPTSFIAIMAQYDKALGISNRGPAHLSVSDGQVVSSDELLGGKVVYVSKPASGADLNKAVQQFKLGIGNNSEKNDVDSKGDVAVLSTSEVSDAAGAIKLIGERLSGFNRKFEARDKNKEMVAKELDKIEKKLAKGEKDMSAEEKQASQSAIRSARALVEMADQPVTDFARYLMTTLATVVSWGEKSLSMYKES